LLSSLSTLGETHRIGATPKPAVRWSEGGSWTVSGSHQLPHSLAVHRIESRRRAEFSRPRHAPWGSAMPVAFVPATCQSLRLTQGCASRAKPRGVATVLRGC